MDISKIPTITTFRRFKPMLSHGHIALQLHWEGSTVCVNSRTTPKTVSLTKTRIIKQSTAAFLQVQKKTTESFTPAATWPWRKPYPPVHGESSVTTPIPIPIFSLSLVWYPRPSKDHCRKRRMAGCTIETPQEEFNSEIVSHSTRPNAKWSARPVNNRPRAPWDPCR